VQNTDVLCRRELRGRRGRLRVSMSGTVQRSSLPAETWISLCVDVAVPQRCPLCRRATRRLSLSLPSGLQRLTMRGRRRRGRLLRGTLRRRLDVPLHPRRRRVRVRLPAREAGTALRAPTPGRVLGQRHGLNRRRRIGADRFPAGSVLLSVDSLTIDAVENKLDVVHSTA